MNDRFDFDALAKELARGVSRREALRRLGGGLAGALLASLGLAGEAWSALRADCRDRCKALGAKGKNNKQCMDACLPCASANCVSGSPGSVSCCSPGTGCSGGSCVPAKTCSGDTCSGPGAFPCATDPDCFCQATTEGANLCLNGSGQSCQTSTPCTSSADCPSGSFCAGVACCVTSGICLPAGSCLT